MNFAEALLLLFKGNKIRLKYWDDNTYLVRGFIKIENNESNKNVGFDFNFVVKSVIFKIEIVNNTVRESIFTPNQDELWSEDWENYGDEPKLIEEDIYSIRNYNKR